MDEVEAIAGRLTEKQRELLLRHESTLEPQAITQAECFDGEVELFVEMAPEVYDPEYGCLIDPGEKAWLASMSATSPAGSSEWTECSITYTPLGRAVRRHLTETQSHAS